MQILSADWQNLVFTFLTANHAAKFVYDYDCDENVFLTQPLSCTDRSISDDDAVKWENTVRATGSLFARFIVPRAAICCNQYIW